MLRRTIVIFGVLITAACSGGQVLAPSPTPHANSYTDGIAVQSVNRPDMSGTWRLDRDLTTANLRWNKTNRIIVNQSTDDITIQYFHDDQSLGAETFVPDRVERPRYKTRIERAFARVQWEKCSLLIRTRAFLDALGYQSYTMEDRWELSSDGNTLTEKGSDGKLIVFYRISPKTGSAPPVSCSPSMHPTAPKY